MKTGQVLARLARLRRSTRCKGAAIDALSTLSNASIVLLHRHYRRPAGAPHAGTLERAPRGARPCFQPLGAAALRGSDDRLSCAGDLVAVEQRHRAVLVLNADCSVCSTRRLRAVARTEPPLRSDPWRPLRYGICSTTCKSWVITALVFLLPGRGVAPGLRHPRRETAPGVRRGAGPEARGKGEPGRALLVLAVVRATTRRRCHRARYAVGRRYGSGLQSTSSGQQRIGDDRWRTTRAVPPQARRHDGLLPAAGRPCCCARWFQRRGHGQRAKTFALQRPRRHAVGGRVVYGGYLLGNTSLAATCPTLATC
jgi:hypothetical protein